MARNLQHMRRRALPLALIAALLLVVIGQALAQPGPPAEPLLPNTEPGDSATADIPIWMLSEQEAVEATLRAYVASDQLAAAEAQALLEQFVTEEAPLLPEQPAAPQAPALEAISTVYLPLLRKAAPVGQQPPPPTPIPPTPTPQPEPAAPADVAVTIWPKPSIWVARGATLEYEIRLANYGRGAASQTTVVFPINRAQVSQFSTSLDSKAGDWVRSVDEKSITIVFGKLDSGARRSGKLFMRVHANLPLPSPSQPPVLIDTRASYTFRDGANGGGQRTNWAPVLVGNDGSSDAPYIWVRVTPDRGPAGTRHSFFTNRFLPGETVTTWLNTPWGVQPLSLRGTANGEGIVELVLNSAGLARGTYQIVLYGQRSGLTGVASFIVE
ncbi:MAG: hypothetical protein HXY37_08380 [Chloroflexi bacterium]|nr:hypothetical protein [Chloroflexota bacterium]